MNRSPSPRVLAALAALVALAPLPAPLAAAEESTGSTPPTQPEGTPIPAASADGWPRSSDKPPPSLPGCPGGYGDPQGAGGEQYDTNVVFDASPGDTDVVAFRVLKASIVGWGNVVDADPSSATTKSGAAWAEAIEIFRVSAEPTDEVQINVLNPIRISATWHLRPGGWNTLSAKGRAMDILGGVHALEVVEATSAPASWTASTSLGGSSSAGMTTGASLSLTDLSASADKELGAENHFELKDEETLSGGASESGQLSYSAMVRDTTNAHTYTAHIASMEHQHLSAQAVKDGVGTSVDVPDLSTVNDVFAAYLVVGADDDPGGPGTPGGGEPAGPITGGDDPPSGGDEGTGVVTPSGEDEPDPPAPPGDGDDGGGDGLAPPPDGTAPDDEGDDSGADESGGDALGGEVPEPAEDPSASLPGGSTSGEDGSPSGGTAPEGTGESDGTSDPEGGGTAPPEGSIPLPDDGGSVPDFDGPLDGGDSQDERR